MSSSISLKSGRGMGSIELDALQAFKSFTKAKRDGTKNSWKCQSETWFGDSEEKFTDGREAIME